MSGIALLVGFVLRHPVELQRGISIYGLPILALRTKWYAPYGDQVVIMLVSLLLNTLVLVATGWYCSRHGRIKPQSLLLAFVASYLAVNIGTTMAVTVDVARHAPNAAAFLLLRALIALPFAPALLLLGGMRGARPGAKQA